MQGKNIVFSKGLLEVPNDCKTIMDEKIRIILIIAVSVSIFGLLVFVFVKNYIKKKIEYYLEEKNKKNYKKPTILK